MARPVFSAEQVEETRQRLCLLALSLYRANGYEAVTLRELGTAADVSHATPYRYFHSKEDLFMHVRATVFQQLYERLRERDRPGNDPLSRLRCIVRTLAEFGRQSPEDYRLIFAMRQAATDDDSPLAKVRSRTLEHVVSVCQCAIDAQQIGGDALTQAHLAWASVHGLLSLHVSNHLRSGRKLDELLSPMIDRLFGPTSASKRLSTREPRSSRSSRQTVRHS